jgi:lipopolysaccharide export system permease protein
MPGILFRHIFIELLKVLLVTTAILGTVVSFGATIKPLSENVLGPADLLRFMGFITVPMMQYALPFAAAFAGTVVYHRLTTDNEVVAMAASGIPYRRILMPAMAMGLLLTGVMVVLVDVGVPTFWQAAKRIIWNDGTRILAAKSGRGEAWRPPGSQTEIFADDAYIQELPALGEEDPAMRLVLDRVVALQFGDDGLPESEFTAQSAAVDQYRIGDRAYLKTVLSNATIFHRGEQQIARATIVRPDAISIPTFEQGPKGLTVRELLHAREDLAVFPAVAEQRDRVIEQLDMLEYWRAISADLAAGRPLLFRGTGDARRMLFEVRATGLRGRDLIAPDRGAEGVVIIQHELPLTSLERSEGVPADAVKRREVHAPSVRITLDMLVGEALGAQRGRFALSADKAIVFDAHSAERGGRQVGSSGGQLGRGIERPIRFSELLLDGASLPDRSGLRDTELLAAVDAAKGVGLVGPAEELRRGLDARMNALGAEMRKKGREIVARLVQRSAQSVTAFLMLVNASILAVLLRQRTPLLVYSVAFIPAILNIVLISGGEQMLRNELNAAGFAVAYSGNVALAACSIVAAWILRRH